LKSFTSSKELAITPSARGAGPGASHHAIRCPLAAPRGR
jgi:hypothetical protein